MTFYKRNEKEILLILLAIFIVGTILIWVDLGMNSFSFVRPTGQEALADSDSIAVVDSVGIVEKHDVRYELREDDNSIIAYIDGKCINTGIRDREEDNVTNCIIKIDNTVDLDNDGYAEAILMVEASSTGGNLSFGFHSEIVHYDQFSDKFKNIEFISQSRYESCIIERWCDQWSLVANYQSSFYFERYIFVNGGLQKAETVEKDVPQSVLAYTLESLFPNGGSEPLWYLTLYDINDDGEPDEIMMAYPGNAHVYNWGNLLVLNNIILSNGKKHSVNLAFQGNVGILQTKTNGMHDLIEQWEGASQVLFRLYKWDGNTYHAVRWNGSQWVRYDDAEWECVLNDEDAEFVVEEEVVEAVDTAAIADEVNEIE